MFSVPFVEKVCFFASMMVCFLPISSFLSRFQKFVVLSCLEKLNQESRFVYRENIDRFNNSVRVPISSFLSRFQKFVVLSCLEKLNQESRFVYRENIDRFNNSVKERTKQSNR
jgi:hypothetical protein